VSWRVGQGTAQTCPYFRNTNNLTDLGVYKHQHTVYTLQYGTYYDDWVYTSGLLINGSGSCANATHTTNKISGFNYGTLTSTVNTFDTPVDPASVMTAAQGNVVWGGWSDPPTAFQFNDGAGLFSALNEDAYSGIFVDANTNGPTNPTTFDWTIQATYTQSQLKFRLLLPLAVQVLCQTGTLATGDTDYTWTDDATFTLTPGSDEHVVDVTPSSTAGTNTRKMMKRLIFHPYT